MCSDRPLLSSPAGGCPQIHSRDVCLQSVDVRNYEVHGVVIHLQACAWCRHGPCVEGGSPCEPRIWLESKGIYNFDACLFE